MMMLVLMISNTKMFKNAHVNLNANFNIAVPSYKYFLTGMRVHLIMALYIISYPHMHPPIHNTIKYRRAFLNITR